MGWGDVLNLKIQKIIIRLNPSMEAPRSQYGLRELLIPFFETLKSTSNGMYITVYSYPLLIDLNRHNTTLNILVGRPSELQYDFKGYLKGTECTLFGLL